MCSVVRCKRIQLEGKVKISLVRDQIGRERRMIREEKEVVEEAHCGSGLAQRDHSRYGSVFGGVRRTAPDFPGLPLYSMRHSSRY